MSGLAALVHRDGSPVDQAVVWRMLQSVPYRGPDGLAVTAIERAVVLGHARMDITPEDAYDAQPLVSPRSGSAIVADVRLDNREQLVRLIPSGQQSGLSDADLILRGYDEWGPGVLDRLLGDFAFVIWDPRHQRIIAARDTSGQRSLFYRIDSQMFIAASEIHQLFQEPSIPIRPNENRIKEFLVPANMNSNEKGTEETFYEGIFSVPAGHVLTLTPDSVALRRYWRLSPTPELRYRDDSEYADQFQDIFSQVVKSRIRVSGRIGALLSGGLDSSSVACTALEFFRAEGRPATDFSGFSMVFDGLDCDERDLVQAMLSKYEFDAHFLPLGHAGGRLRLEPVGFMEAPNMGIAEVRDAIFSVVQASGARVLLTGDLADSCVGGSRYVFDSLIRSGRIREYLEHVRAYRRVSTDSFKRIAGRYTLLPLLPLQVQKRINVAFIRRDFAQARQQLLPAWMPQALRDGLSARHCQLLIEREQNRQFSNDTREAEYRMLYPPEVARHPVPWPIQMWRPYADRRLHEFLLAIPPEQKFKPHPDTDEFYAGSKRVVRQAMTDIVPDVIRTRLHKTMFQAVGQSELELNWPLYETAFGPTSRPAIVERGYVDQEKFWSRLQVLRSRSDLLDAPYLMQMVNLETWLRSFKLTRDQLATVPSAQVNHTLSGQVSA